MANIKNGAGVVLRGVMSMVRALYGVPQITSGALHKLIKNENAKRRLVLLVSSFCSVKVVSRTLIVVSLLSSFNIYLDLITRVLQSQTSVFETEVSLIWVGNRFYG